MYTDYGHWEIFEDFNPVDYYGFIYLIENTVNGRKYIGKKSFNEGWRKYYSSSCNDEFWNDIELYGIENFNFLILELVKGNNIVLSEREEILLIRNNVLKATLPSGEYAYYNKNIGNSKWRPSAISVNKGKFRYRDIKSGRVFMSDEETCPSGCAADTSPNKDRIFCKNIKTGKNTWLDELKEGYELADPWNKGKRPFKSYIDNKIIWATTCPENHGPYAYHTGKRTWKNFETGEVVYAIDCPAGFNLSVAQSSPVSIEGKIYNSINSAARVLNISAVTIRRYCESEDTHLDWFYSEVNNIGMAVKIVESSIKGCRYFINKITGERVLAAECPEGFEKYIKETKPNHTEAGLKRIASGNRDKSKSPVMAGGMAFEAINLAAKHFNMSKTNVGRRCNLDKYIDWYYIK